MITYHDGTLWADGREMGPDGPTNDELNRDCLAPLSRKHGYDLCIHPMQSLINFDELACNWCGQTVTPESHTPEARELRTQEILRVYPHLAKQP